MISGFFLLNLFMGVSSEFESLVYSVLFLLASQVGLSLFNRTSVLRKLNISNEVTGIMFGTVSLIYSLILAFVIVAVWDNYDELDKAIENEADGLNSILAHSATLPDTVRCQIANAMFAYCHQVIEKEWKMERREEKDQPSAIPAMRLMLLKMEPHSQSEQNIFSVMDNGLSRISDLRRSRLCHNKSHVPPLVWLILKAWSVMLILFSYLFQVPSFSLKSIYVFVLASCITMCMFLVYTLDHPFAGSALVSDSPYRNILAELETYYTSNK